MERIHITLTLAVFCFRDCTLLVRGCLGLRGLGALGVEGEHGGVAPEGDPGLTRGDMGFRSLFELFTLLLPEGTVSPFWICLRFSSRSFWASGSLSHLKKSSSTFTLRSGFKAILFLFS